MAPKQIPQKLMLIGFLNGLCFYAPVALLIRTQNGISISQFFILQMILSIGIFLTEIPAGYLSDRIGYKNTMVLSQLLLLIARFLLLLSDTFWLFAAEAVVEALSISLSSGTESAYIYSYYQEEEYALFNSKIGRAGTFGFLLSTVSYPFILQHSGIAALVAATCITTLLAFVVTITLPKETKYHVTAETIKPHSALPKSSWLFFLLLSAISMAYLVFNFFCAVKINRIGLSYESLTFVILGYSAVELLAPMLIRPLRKEQYRCFIPILLALYSTAFFGLYALDNLLSLLLMLLIPLLLSVLSTLSSEVINESIDRHGLSEQRATVLSIFNIGNSVLEIVFLAASALLSDSDGNSAFLFVAAYALLVCALASVIFLRKRLPSNTQSTIMKIRKAGE